ncbi:MAG: hypothetical protein GC161_18685 [Planctomycetaceae bacterium]|nr:hypothetical protein [Planctomycetaceae bacterium]
MAPEKTAKNDPNAVPAVALVLAWVLPGAGHLYLGRLAAALVGFLAVVGLYAAGVFLADGRTFELLDAELRGPVALALTPEVGCLGAILWQFQTYGFGLGPPLGPPEPLPAGIHLGVLLTALGGLLNLALCVDAHTAARLRPRAGVRAPALLVAAGWLLPGLGHWLQGRRVRALVVGLLVIGLFAYGTHLAEGSNLSRERHFYYWAAQVLAGAPAVLLEQLSGHAVFSRALPSADVGLLFAALAGLFNAVLLIDVYGWQEALQAGRDPRQRDQAHAAALSAGSAPSSTATAAPSAAEPVAAPVAAPAATPGSAAAPSVEPGAPDVSAPPRGPSAPKTAGRDVPPTWNFPGDSPLAPPRP